MASAQIEIAESHSCVTNQVCRLIATTVNANVATRRSPLAGLIANYSNVVALITSRSASERLPEMRPALLAYQRPYPLSPAVRADVEGVFLSGSEDDGL